VTDSPDEHFPADRLPESRPEHPEARWFNPPFAIRRPSDQTLPVVFDSPHSGRSYPPSFLAKSRLDAVAIRKSEDCFVDQLFAGVVARGAPLLQAHFPRAYLDVNREPYELDPDMFADVLPAHANTQSERVRSGLGTVARVVSDGSEIYRDKLAYHEDVAWRIQHLHEPYHRMLAGLLAETRARFGHVVLVDCHSMPSSGLSPPPVAPRPRADIVLGDRFGGACASPLVSAAESYLRSRGYRVARNVPYAGGYICLQHGKPALGQHVIQIEISRALYMTETAFEPHAGFTRMAADMAGLARVLADALALLEPNRPLAAE
jgi:N-formylglutamate amidohydrolase